MSHKVKLRGDVYYLHATIGGRRIRESLGTGDKEVAGRKAAARAARLYRAEEFGAESVYTFADAALSYMEAGHETRYLGPIIERMGKMLLREIRPGHVRELARDLKPGTKNSTMNRHVIVPARSVINHAADLGWCAHIKIKSYPEAGVLKQAIDRGWIDAFREHACHQRLGTLALFMFTTGARISEAVALRPDDLDLEAKLARIDKTKNGDPRLFHLTDELVRELRLCQPRKVRDGTTRVFGYSHANALVWAWDNAIAKAGIPYVSRHEAGRHSAATEAVVRNKVDPVTASALLGWKDPKVLLKRYAHAEGLGSVAEEVFGTNPAQAGGRLRVVGEKKKD